MQGASTFGMTRRSGGLYMCMSMQTQTSKEVRTARLRCQSVQRVVALAVCADLAAERERRAGRERLALSVDVHYRDLYGRMVLRGDEAVCERLSVLHTR